MSVKPARDVEQELIVVPDKKMPNLYVVRYKDKGVTPDYLGGLFSTRIAAKKKIMFYEARPKPQDLKYSHQKSITNEEEAELYEKIKKEVEAKNNGKEDNTEKKKSSRKE